MIQTKVPTKVLLIGKFRNLNSTPLTTFQTIPILREVCTIYAQFGVSNSVKNLRKPLIHWPFNEDRKGRDLNPRNHCRKNGLE